MPLDYCLRLQPLWDDGLALDLTLTCFAVILAVTFHWSSWVFCEPVGQARVSYWPLSQCFQD